MLESDEGNEDCICFIDPPLPQARNLLALPEKLNCNWGELLLKYIDKDESTMGHIDYHTLRIHDGPVTCLSFSDDQLLIGGSSFGRVSLSDLSTGERVAKLMSADSAGINTLCFNPCSHLLFGGSSAGRATCWDLRTLRSLWEVRVSPNVIHSMHYMRDDTTTLVVGGLDGVLRFLDQSTGEVMSCCIMDERSSNLNRLKGVSYWNIGRRKGRRISEDTRLDLMPKSSRPSINCLSVGMQKVVTTNGDGYIRVWKFNK